jgi:hypothetical protein
MALLFLLASLVWFALSAAWWREIIAVQYAISAVLFLCLVEMTTWHFVWNRCAIRARLSARARAELTAAA